MVSAHFSNRLCLVDLGLEPSSLFICSIVQLGLGVDVKSFFDILHKRVSIDSENDIFMGILFLENFQVFPHFIDLLAIFLLLRAQMGTNQNDLSNKIDNRVRIPVDFTR
jgi:hypothetical protein